MKKFTNHVDHVAWISRPENLEANVVMLEKMSEAKLTLVGDPDDCIREMQRVNDLIDPEYAMMTPTGVPDPDQQIRELRLFAKEVMPQFKP